ncbi:aminodeoxychorismate synthase component I [Aquisalibacillus elongatus]|uniref:Aminodeoxychorismate synthase subunit I /aminodeoxychorismate lyase apoprotein n=1 Tax=Aquisalibacillus elongatus TaxID=485577 RepID=A0A3N5BER7_9BACI|nr:aminodeoxychorismate synthase component I [Aquisalibacillus elongatus]RPF55379.1 aminodeoxychorismate synthase subunit I /aminodeoxychorismate lyase apoprotein [Aquisalibacillus elongatus]
MTKQVVHFKHPWLDDDSFVFEKPYDFVVANDLSEVKTAIRRVEQYTKNGYYAVGYVSYEASKAFNERMVTYESVRLPYVYFGIYEDYHHIYEIDNTPLENLNWKSDTSRSGYHQSISNIHLAIKKGLSYQVNFTIRLIAEFQQLNTRKLYEQLRQSQQAHYTAHLSFNDFEIISVSPELFFAWDGEQIETKPMKGTIKRGSTDTEDNLNKNYLRQSTKDRAENVMIVDLIRNDLSKIAQKGSVHVPKLFDIEEYPTVFQMTSTVRAKTKPEVNLVSIFESLFPCGSITGAPKISTMELIKHLESTPREVYCGAVGIITPEGQAIFNVPIRTVWVDHRRNQAIYGVGGGITWDSTAEGEYDEALAKAKVLKPSPATFQLLETMTLEQGQFDLWQEHMNRLLKSATFFNFNYDLKLINQKLNQIREQYNDGVYKIRLLLSEDGQIQTEVTPIDHLTQSYNATLASRPINRQDIFYYHKTTFRDHYHGLKNETYDETLLWNEAGYVTEFINGNLVYELEGQYFTPPKTDGLLAGTYRERLLEQGIINIRSLHKSKLDQVDKLWFINSVRGWVSIEQCVKERV